jgi:hypothetical protein
MPLARTWLWMTLLSLSLLVISSAALVLIAAALTPFQPRPANGFSADSYLGKSNRSVTVIRPNRPRMAAESVTVNTGWGATIEALCVVINERAVWESGNTTSTMSAHFMQAGSVTFVVDGLRYDLSNEAVTLMAGLIMRPVFDDQNQIIGSYGYAEYCLDTTYLPSGVHGATILVNSLSGVEHQYHWFMVIADSAPQLAASAAVE